MSYEANEISKQKIDRRLKQKRMERSVRRAQIKLHRFRIFIRIVSIICLIVFAFKIVKYSGWYLNKSAFNTPENKYLKIHNNLITPDYKVLSALRQIPIPNHPIYMINPKIFEEAVKTLEPVKNVVVKRYIFPARLSVYVIEREPIFTIAPVEDAPPVAFFTNDGKLIGRDYLPLPETMKTYRILSYGNKGDDYDKWSKEKVLRLYNLAQLVEKATEQELLYLDMRNPNDIYIQIETVKIRIGELNTTLLERVGRIAMLDEMTKDIDKPIEYIDLSWDGTPYIKLKN